MKRMFRSSLHTIRSPNFRFRFPPMTCRITTMKQLPICFPTAVEEFKSPIPEVADESFEKDHFIPQHDNPPAPHGYSNLYYACTRCNNKKDAISLAMFLENAICLNWEYLELIRRFGKDVSFYQQQNIANLIRNKYTMIFLKAWKNDCFQGRRML